jgi:cephalosporin hydroxylase
LAEIKAKIPEGTRVMIVLDSDHSREHLLKECLAYGDIVTPGCYTIVADTMMGTCRKKIPP